MTALCDKIVFIDAEPTLRLRRIMERDGISAQEAQRRIDAQAFMEAWKAQSDLVVDNSGERNRLEEIIQNWMEVQRVVIVKKRRIVAGIVIAVIALVLAFQIKPILRRIYKMPHYDIVEQMSQKYKVDHFLIYAMMKAESSFRTDAQSHVGAKGLMQVMDKTANGRRRKLALKIFSRI